MKRTPGWPATVAAVMIPAACVLIAATNSLTIWLTAWSETFPAWIGASILLGLGTAMVYPALLAEVSDRSPVAHRAGALGVYRFWRDLGYAVGALISGVVADIFGFTWAIVLVGAMTLASGLAAGVLMGKHENHVIAWHRRGN